MSVAEVAQEILDSERAAGLLQGLGHRSVRIDFPAIDGSGDMPTIPWGWALSAASVLTGQSDARAQDAALRIVYGCLISADSLQHHRDAAVVLLERLGNRPAINLAVERDLASRDAWTEVPGPLQLDVVRRRLELGIPLAGGVLLAANVFQRQFWTAVGSAQWVSVSAPTSAGKSFIVRRWFQEQLTDTERFTGVYLVPTRALIEEVSADLSAELADSDVGVYTLPWDDEIAERTRKILVLTQERLHLVQQRLPEEPLDLLFIDEAQKFGDGSRGVLLQQTVEEATRRAPDAQVVFASPLTSNPEALLDATSPGQSSAVILSETVTVNQNLLWADQVKGRPTRWRLRLVLDGEPSDVGHFDLPARPAPASQRLPLVAVALGEDSGGNVVYVNGPADAEKAAAQIYDALGPGAVLTSEDVADLRDLVRRTVHNQYSLVRVLERGVAFHYGNMPLLVRTEIERLFREGVLRYLICTSTLLEGVNLPCRNLFASNPKKGNGNPMTAADFWNLAGRAGRWGQEFQGNIVCVDASLPARWPELPRRRERHAMARATSVALADAEQLEAYIADGAPPDTARREPMLESMYSYLAGRVLSGAGLGELPQLSAEAASRLTERINAANANLEVAADLVQRHAGVSPAAMQRLLIRFRQYEDADALRLPPPEDDDAVRSYTSALGRCQQELGANFGLGPRQFQLALLITNWMRGWSLARLIADRIRYLKAKDRPYKLPNVIRETMKDVEQVARFQAPRYLGCYTDILALHMRQIGKPPDELPLDMTMMLELGVSRTTEVSLMALGLSRTGAIELGELIVEDDLDRQGVRAWIENNRDAQLGLAAIIRREIARALGE